MTRSHRSSNAGQLSIRRDVEEEDESGAPEKVAWPKTADAHPLEPADELREPPYERSEDVTESEVNDA